MDEAEADDEVKMIATNIKRLKIKTGEARRIILGSDRILEKYLVKRRWTLSRAFMSLCCVYTIQLSDRPVGPTGRSDRSVQPVGPTVGSCKRSYDRSYDRSDESNLSNSSNRSDQQLHRLNVHPTVGPTIGPTMQMRSPNQPMKSTYNHDALNDVIFLSALNITS